MILKVECCRFNGGSQNSLCVCYSVMLGPDIPIHDLFCTVLFISAVREITKRCSTFSSANISSNKIWLLQLRDTIQMKSNYTWINYNHDSIAIKSHIYYIYSVWNFIFGTKFSSIYFFNYHLLTCSMLKMILIFFMQNIDMCLLYKSHQMLGITSN